MNNDPSFLENNLYERKYNFDFFYAHNITTTGGSSDGYHFHDNYEIYFSLTNAGNIRINDQIYPLNYGDLFIINNFDIHHCQIPKSLIYNRYVIMFNPDFIRGLSSKHLDILGFFNYDSNTFNHKIPLNEYSSFISSNDLITLLDKIGTIYDSDPSPEKEIYLKLEFGKLLITIHKILLKRQQNNFVLENNMDKNLRIHNLLKYINTHISEELSIDSLSKEAYISKYYLCHYFKKITGISIGNYIIKCRIEIAKQLIESGADTATVLEKSGFNDYSHFIRTFKSHIGLPPKQYFKNLGIKK